MNGLAAVLGAVLSAVGTALYLRDVWCGRTVPHRGSWAVWGVIAVLAAAAHGADGGRWSLLVLVGQGAGTVLVALLAVRRGAGRLTLGNALLLSVAALGLLGWATLSDPTVASACAVLADAAGLAVMWPKTWADPGSETLATYALAAATGLLAALAVPAWDRDLLLFPVYFCVGNAATAGLIAVRRRAAGPVASAPGVRCGPVPEVVATVGSSR